MPIYRYPVEKKWVAGLPNNPYRKGVAAYEGVVLHFTANYTSTIDGEVDWMAQNWNNAFVHEYVSAARAVQTANPDYKAWGAGKYANERFIHIELCVSHTKDEFLKSLDIYCERAAEYLAAKKLGVTPAKADGTGTLWSHKDVSLILGATDHTDPIEYLAEWGLTWQDVVAKVAAYYAELTAPQVDLNAKEHVVVAGDSLSVIAELYGKTLDEVLACNPEITDRAMIHIGQCIKLVRPAPAPAPIPAPVPEPPKPPVDPVDQAVADAGVPEWARPAVAKAIRKGVITDATGDVSFWRTLCVLDRLGLIA